MEEYILVDKKVVAEPDAHKWGKWMQDNPRHVADTHLTEVPHTKGARADGEATEFEEVRISTVFLGLDHGFSDHDNNMPLIFETMIFGGEHDEYQRRCYTWEEAEAMHMRACKLVIMGEREE